MRLLPRSASLQNNALDLIESDLVVAPIVKLCRACALMRCHLLGVLEETAIEQIDGDAGRAEAVAADAGEEPGFSWRGGRSCVGRPDVSCARQ
jgi:hypothetical protein